MDLQTSCSKWCNGKKPNPQRSNTNSVFESSCGWDLKQSSQASGKVKEARVIAVTYLGGKMFARVSSVLFSDSLGHEIVPLSTLASPKPKSIAHPQPGGLAFPHVCPCTLGLSVCLWSSVWVFVWVVVDVCVFEGLRGAEDGWVLDISWPSPFLSDWQNKWASAAKIMGCMGNCGRMITEHFTLESERERETQREADLRTVAQVLLEMNHASICSFIYW